MQELEPDLGQRHEEEEKDWISEMFWRKMDRTWQSICPVLAIDWLCGLGTAG